MTCQQIRTLATCPKDSDSIPGTQMEVHKLLYLQYQGINSLFWPLWAARMLMIHRHTYRLNTHKHKVIIKVDIGVQGILIYRKVGTYD